MYILCILCISNCILLAYFFAYSVAYLAYWQECIFYIFWHMLHNIFIFICILLCIFCIYMINMHMQIDFDDLKCLSPGLHCLFQLLLGPPSQGPAVHVPPSTTIDRSPIYHRKHQESQPILVAWRRVLSRSRPLEPEEGVPVWRTLESHTRLVLVHGARRRLRNWTHLIVQSLGRVWETGSDNMLHMQIMQHM